VRSSASRDPFFILASTRFSPARSGFGSAFVRDVGLHRGAGSLANAGPSLGRSSSGALGPALDWLAGVAQSSATHNTR
jgi:hypothetical protein